MISGERERRAARIARLARVVSIAIGVVLATPPASLAQPPGSTAPVLTAVVGTPVLTAVIGTVEVRPAGSHGWEPAAEGRELQSGDMLRTGSRSKAEVAHPTGTIRLFEQTLLRLPMETASGVRTIRRVDLFAGESLFSVVPRVLPRRVSGLLTRLGLGSSVVFEVVTPYIVCGVKGTEFVVSQVGPTSAVGVYSGRVETARAGGSRGRDRALVGSGQLAAYSEGRLSGVAGFEGGRGLGAWADPETHAPPGVAAASAAAAAAGTGDGGGSNPGGGDGGAGAAAGGPAGGAGAAGGGGAGAGPAGAGPAGGGPAGGGGGAGGGTGGDGDDGDDGDDD